MEPTPLPSATLIGWTAIMGLTALLFWATLRPVRRRA
jgi:hypothetical protein